MIKFGNNDTKMYLGNNEIEKVYIGTSQVYEGGDTPTPPAPVPYSGQYLTFVAERDNMSVGLTYANNNVFQYSVDSGATWSNLANSGSTTAVNSGQTIMFKASGLSVSSGDGIGTLTPSVSASVQGNIMSLVYGDDFSGQTTIPKNEQFRGLFYECANLTSAENLILPATTLRPYCYGGMFSQCTSLTSTPVLPATELSLYCYRTMFYGCTSLTTAPVLPVTTLANWCYQGMFQDCTSLTTAPELPAITLVYGCYQNMFRGCRSLNYIKCLATDESADGSTDNWVNGVAATGTFVKAASMSGWSTGTSGIPTGWTIQNDDGSPYIDDGDDDWGDQD